MATVIDVARLAGVSPSTVSNVLNNPARVRQTTRRRVLDAAADLNFQPNVVARSLRYGASPFTAIIVSDPRVAYVAEVVRSAQRALAEAGRLALVVSTDDDDAQLRESIEQLRAVGVTSFVLSPTPYRYSEESIDYLRSLNEQGLALSIITNQLPDAPFDVVTTGSAEGTTTMVRHLTELGHTRIAFVGPGQDRVTPGFLRFEGYRKGMIDAGLQVHEEYLIDGSLDVETGKRAVRHLLATDRRPTAIVTADDTIAAGVVSESHRNNIAVPDDWSVCGSNDEPIAKHVHPPLTTLAMAGTAAGQAATQLLIARVENRELPRGQRHHIDYELVVRESTAPPPQESRP